MNYNASPFNKTLSFNDLPRLSIVVLPLMLCELLICKAFEFSLIELVTILENGIKLEQKQQANAQCDSSKMVSLNDKLKAAYFTSRCKFGVCKTCTHEPCKTREIKKLITEKDVALWRSL
jgi:hypothetical protein